MSNCYHVWAKCKQTNQWTAYKTERNIYNRLLKGHKKQSMSKKILKNRKNTKQLFKIVNKVTKNSQQNPLPDGNPEELAEEFINCFLNKIKTIRKLL